MGAYKHIKETFEREYKERDDHFKNNAVNWRKESSVARVERPTNLTRARELGYKAKQGIIVARIRVKKGLRKRDKPRGGRKPSKSGRYFAFEKSLQSIAEERASRKFMNCEVLNSYYVGEDGKYKFFEAVLVDRAHPAIKNDSFYSKIINRRGRAFRAVTYSGRTHRGIA